MASVTVDFTCLVSYSCVHVEPCLVSVQQKVFTHHICSYLQEQELEAHRKRTSRRFALVDDQWYKTKDPDDRNEPPGGCGLGGGGGGVPSGHLVF